MHRRVGYACVTKPEQRSALNRCTCQKLASCVGSAPVASRGAPAAAAPSAHPASNVHKLADAKNARLKRPVLEDAPKPVAAGSFYAAGFSGIRRAPLASVAKHAFVVAAAGQSDDGARCRGDGGLDGFDVVVLRRGRCRGAELRERAAPRGSRSGANGHDCSSRLA